jgi:hypothetical protein
MAIESDNERNTLVLARIGNRLPNNLLMSQMHAIEKPNRKADLAFLGFQIYCRMDDIHGETAPRGLANQYGASSSPWKGRENLRYRLIVRRKSQPSTSTGGFNLRPKLVRLIPSAAT